MEKGNRTSGDVGGGGREVFSTSWRAARARNTKSV